MQSSGCARPVQAAQPLPTQREIVRRAMAQRPDDPWPRGLAHVVLAIPGSQQPEKSYHEPGGSFSPAVGSFGVSIWVKDSAARLKTSSDALPMKQIEQRFSWPNPQGVPAIVTTTPHYHAAWSCLAAGTTTLEVQPRGDGAERLELAVRSVGPAGGPIEKIAWNGRQLRINDRWTLSVEPPPAAVSVGHEGDPGWVSNRSPAREWSGKDGWGFARIELAAAPAARLTLHDSTPPQPNPLVYPAVRSTLELDLPDRRFIDCLNAQVAHLMMGLLDRRTPPGEPTNYPLAWQRDGVAVVAGLVRAGQLDVAKAVGPAFRRERFLRRLRRRGRCAGPGPAGVGRRGRPPARSGVRPMAMAARRAESGDHLEDGLDGQAPASGLFGSDRSGPSQSRRFGSCLRSGPRRTHHGPHGFGLPGVVYHGGQLPGTPRRGVVGAAFEAWRRGRSLAGRSSAAAKGLARRATVEGAANLHLGGVAHLGRSRRQVELSRTPSTELGPPIVPALDLFQRG